MASPHLSLRHLPGCGTQITVAKSCQDRLSGVNQTFSLLSTFTTGEPTWPEVRGLCEGISSVTYHSIICSTVQQKAFIILSCQHNRCFVSVVSFANHSFRLTLCECGGIVMSATGNIERDSYILFHIIIALVLGNDEVLGYDAIWGMMQVCHMIHVVELYPLWQGVWNTG